MQDDNERAYQTSDFPLASYLYSQGILLKDIIPSPNDSHRKVFVFEYPAEELLSEYQSGKANINVLAFTNAQNTLKTMLRISGQPDSSRR